MPIEQPPMNDPVTTMKGRANHPLPMNTESSEQTTTIINNNNNGRFMSTKPTNNQSIKQSLEGDRRETGPTNRSSAR
jgi:hypothetical protein